MEKLVAKLRADYPGIVFTAADMASWSSQQRRVTYNLAEEAAPLSLLHELGHALLEHDSYKSDISLLRKEVEAWEKAKTLAVHYGITIAQEHIDNCLDTYRDWLHKRSTCPTCQSHGLQRTQAAYGCLNCQSTWKVTSERFCRPYRLKKPQTV